MYIDTLMQEYILIRDELRKAKELEEKLRIEWDHDNWLTDKELQKVRKSWLSQLEIISNLSQKANKAKTKIAEEIDTLSDSVF